MINKKLARAIAATAGVGLAFAGLVGVAAPAQAVDNPTTSFKIHLNVPASVAASWNIWSWGDCNGANDNVIGSSTRNIGSDAAPNNVTQDWTPNFSNDDAYGSYAEFTVPCTVTALNNVMRTTESWGGQDAADAVVDDPATTDVDETAAAKPAIAEADKPFGGDNIFPKGESWWNVNTGKREYPLKDMVDYKIHLNMSLANAQSNGWNLWTWGPYTPAQTVALSKFKVGSKFPYKGKVSATITGVPFTGSDKYGAFAVIKLPRVYVSTLGFLVKQSTPAADWNDNVKSTDFKSDNNNNVAAGTTEAWIQVGGSTLSHKAPTFVGRYGATATYANGVVTVTPVRPSAPSLQGALADKIVVTIKKGATSKTCTIQNAATAAAEPRWATPSSCDIAVAPGAEVATWDVFVQGSAIGVGTALIGPNRSAKVVVPAT
ncbi:MAG: hypothetical protein NTX78_00940 [Rhodoluna sp.]|nr:hypothetical protein [Rhodoluna sp.]